MFRRHRNDPEPITSATLLDRLESVSMSSRTDASSADRRLVRGRLAASASTSHGLRVRLRQPILSAPRG
jgi:hypothetical protein